LALELEYVATVENSKSKEKNSRHRENP